MIKQHTIKEAFELAGKGLHTGLSLNVRFCPAPADFGIRFCRVDLSGKPTYRALADYVTATERGTVLAVGEWRVSTIEHAMSALMAMGVDNCLVEVNGPEMPILDGSAAEYVNVITKIGLQEQDAERLFLKINEPVLLNSATSDSWLRLEPADSFSAEVRVSFASPVLGEQRASLDHLEHYAEQIASARTFCFVREVEPLLQHGLIKGGDLRNAVVIYDELMSQERFDRLAASLSQEIKRDASELGYLTKLHYDNEPARHKLLDLIGDLALAGRPLIAKVTAYKPGHGVNTEFARKLKV